MSHSTRPYPELTPIIRDMQITARELGIVRDLLEVRDRCYADMDPISRQQIDTALTGLGAMLEPFGSGLLC